MLVAFKIDILRTEALISSAKHHLTMGPFGKIGAHEAIAPWSEQGPSSTNNWEMDVISLLDKVFTNCRERPLGR